MSLTFDILEPMVGKVCNMISPTLSEKIWERIVNAVADFSDDIGEDIVFGPADFDIENTIYIGNAVDQFLHYFVGDWTDSYNGSRNLEDIQEWLNDRTIAWIVEDDLIVFQSF